MDNRQPYIGGLLIIWPGICLGKKPLLIGKGFLAFITIIDAWKGRIRILERKAIRSLY